MGAALACCARSSFRLYAIVARSSCDSLRALRLCRRACASQSVACTCARAQTQGTAWRGVARAACDGQPCVTLGRPTQGRIQIQARSQASANSGQIGRQRRSRLRMGRAFRAWRRHRDLLEADALEARRRRVVRLARLGLRLSEARLLVRLLPPPCRRSQAQEVRVHRVSVSARGPIWGPHLHVGLRLLAAAAAAWRGDRRGVATRRNVARGVGVSVGVGAGVRVRVGVGARRAAHDAVLGEAPAAVGALHEARAAPLLLLLLEPDGCGVVHPLLVRHPLVTALRRRQRRLVVARLARPDHHASSAASTTSAATRRAL